jgi:hypothetical protein
MARSAQWLGGSLKTRQRNLFGEDGQFEGTEETCEIAPDADREAVTLVLNDATAASQPARKSDIAKALLRLSAKTAVRPGAPELGELVMTVFAEDLQAYPGDIVLEVIAGWKGKWFPVFDDLDRAISREGRTRQSLLREAQRADARAIAPNIRRMP